MTRRKQKTYATAVAVVLAVLIGERWLRSPAGGTTAAAKAADGPPSPAAATAPSTPAKGRGFSVEAAPFPATPAEQVPPSSARNLFAVADLVMGRLTPLPDPTLTTGDSDAAAVPDGAAGFPARHRLSAVLTGDKIVVAIVDGQWLRLGDAIDGCTLDEVKDMTAGFVCPDGTAQLTIEVVPPGRS